MKRRNLIGSLLAGIGVLFTRGPLAAASGARSGSLSDAPGANPGRDTVSPRATVRVIYSDASQSSWQAVTDGGILVAGATPVAPGSATRANLQIVQGAIKAIAAAGGPTLTPKQVSLFGGQN